MFQNAFKELQSVHPRCGGLHVRDVLVSNVTLQLLAGLLRVPSVMHMCCCLKLQSVVIACCFKVQGDAESRSVPCCYVL
jgi:hypothetical protein